MNLVFLTSHALHQYHLINELHRTHPVRKVFFQGSPPSARLWRKRFARLTSPSQAKLLFRGAAERILFAAERARQRRYEVEHCFPDRPASLDADIPSETLDGFDTPEAVAQVAAEQPDLLVVFGTRRLKGDILHVARQDILNIHRDILPRYRGGGLPWWVLLERDFDNLGVTIHQCTAQLDHGPIVGQQHYRLTGEDRAHTLRYQTTRVAIDLLREVIDRYVAGTVTYRPQVSPTRLYTARELTIFKQLAARRNLLAHVQGL